MSTLLRKTALCLALALGAAAVQAALPADFDAKLAARPEADKARDAARKPKETVALLGLSEGMTVVDVSAGGGWFTRVLSAAVGPQGKVLAQFGERPLQNNNGQAQKDLAAQLGNVEPQFVAMAAMPAGVADAALTALNLHDAFNFRGEEAGVAFVKEIYNVLKPGGVAAIIDHEGNAGVDNKDLHRIAAATVRDLIQKAGFEIVQESDLLNNSADDHSKSSSDETLGRATDQIFFLVRKPG
ncbi:MAG: class I SAM-dependent methyltransferase [Pseudohongiellaceae bacterium]|jgi:predicted methyltransferase